MEKITSFNSDYVPAAPNPPQHYPQHQPNPPHSIQQPVGLKNPGLNCCFMNSTLQLLRSAKELVDFFITGGARIIYEQKQNVNVAKEFDQLLRAWNENVRLDEAHSAFRLKCGTFDPEWTNRKQQDAAHFLLFLLDKLDGDLKLDDGTSIIQQLFQGQMCFSRRCKRCDKVHPKEEVFMTLDLSLISAPTDTSVSGLLSLYTAELTMVINLFVILVVSMLILTPKSE